MRNGIYPHEIALKVYAVLHTSHKFLSTSRPSDILMQNMYFRSWPNIHRLIIKKPGFWHIPPVPSEDRLTKSYDVTIQIYHTQNYKSGKIPILRYIPRNKNFTRC